MTDLKEGTKYFYRVGTHATGFSEVYSFTTMSADAGGKAPLRVASVGDMGYAELSDSTVAQLTKMANTGKIDMVIHSGDIS